MFARVHEMGVLADPSTPATPFVVCYLCSYIDGEGGSVLAWVIDDVLRIASQPDPEIPDLKMLIRARNAV